MGDPFLRAFYTIYDVEEDRIGFVGNITSKDMQLSDIIKTVNSMLPFMFISTVLIITSVCYCLKARLKGSEDSEDEAEVAEED